MREKTHSLCIRVRWCRPLVTPASCQLVLPSLRKLWKDEAWEALSFPDVPHRLSKCRADPKPEKTKVADFSRTNCEIHGRVGLRVGLDAHRKHSCLIRLYRRLLEFYYPKLPVINPSFPLELHRKAHLIIMFLLLRWFASKISTE